MKRIFVWNEKENIFFKVNSIIEDVEELKISLNEDRAEYEVIVLDYCDNIHKELDIKLEDKLYRKIFKIVEKITTDDLYNKSIPNLKELVSEMTESYSNYYNKLDIITEKILDDINGGTVRLTYGKTNDNSLIDVNKLTKFINSNQFGNYFIM